MAFATQNARIIVKPIVSAAQNARIIVKTMAIATQSARIIVTPITLLLLSDSQRGKGKGGRAGGEGKERGKGGRDFTDTGTFGGW